MKVPGVHADTPAESSMMIMIKLAQPCRSSDTRAIAINRPTAFSSSCPNDFSTLALCRIRACSPISHLQFASNCHACMPLQLDVRRGLGQPAAGLVEYNNPSRHQLHGIVAIAICKLKDVDATLRSSMSSRVGSRAMRIRRQSTDRVIISFLLYFQAVRLRVRCNCAFVRFFGGWIATHPWRHRAAQRGQSSSSQHFTIVVSLYRFFRGVQDVSVTVCTLKGFEARAYERKWPPIAHSSHCGSASV